MSLRSLLVLILSVVSLAVQCQNTSTNLETFELPDLPQCWQTIDADGDGFNWESFYQTPNGNGGFVQAFSGVGAWSSASFDNTEGVLEPNNFLVLPQLSIQSGEDLSFYVAATDPDFSEEIYSVVLSTSDASAESFTDTLFTDTLQTTTWEQIEIDLAAYEGQEVYIAFNHYSTDQFRMWIDDVLYPSTVNDCEILVGIEEAELSKFTIYPNPLQGNILNLNFKNSGTFDLSIMDATGKTVLEEKIKSSGNSQIISPNLTSGVYMIQLEGKEGFSYQKLIVE